MGDGALEDGFGAYHVSHFPIGGPSFGPLARAQPSMSPHSVVSGDAHVVFQEAISSSPGTFSQFHDAKATFVDKTLAIEAFLRDIPTHHLILRPRHCGKSYTLSMIRFSSFLTKDPCIWQFADAALREFLQQPLKTGPIPGDQNINNSQFANTAITQHKDLVSQHFQQHPILYIDLKVNSLGSLLKMGQTYCNDSRMSKGAHMNRC